MIRKLIVLCILSYLILVLYVVGTQGYILIVSLVSPLPISLYLALQYRHNNRTRMIRGVYRPGRSFPFILIYLTPIIPAIATALYLEYNILDIGTMYSLLIGFGISLGFNYALVNIPLSIQHKKKENDYKSPVVSPLVTVIVPAYNEESGIGRTLDALVEVDYPNREVIVVDDGSTDQTFKTASSYKTKFPMGRFSIIRKKNGGKASAINNALRFAKGEIIVVIDADAIVARNSVKEIIKQFKDEDVGAIAGNPRVLNRKTIWSKIQVLEYLVGITLFKRAYAVFGVVMVVPGGLGAFRKSLMLEGGLYDNDTLTEDFDITLKILKSGKRIVMSSTAISYSEVPETLRDLYKQRMRWQGGNLQTLIKHRDIMTNKNFNLLYKYGYPLILLTMLTLPFLGMVVAGFIFVAIFDSMWMVLLSSFLAFTSLSFVLAAIAIMMEEEDWKSIIYAPLMVAGYKQILDFFTVKSTFDVIFRRNMKWNPSKRYGMQASVIPTKK